MSILEIIKNRKSVRAYLDRPVEKEKIDKILDAARYSPSGANTQPWQVAIITGKTKERLQNRIEADFRSGNKGKADYSYYPTAWIEPYKSRRKECALLLYQTLKIERYDTQRQLEQWAANYRAFDAPVMLLFFIDDQMEKGSYIDYGMFLQSIMLAAVDLGLATCPQASIADYPEIVRSELDYPKDKILLCGMALGYEDNKAVVNSYRTARESVDSFSEYFY